MLGPNPPRPRTSGLFNPWYSISSMHLTSSHIKVCHLCVFHWYTCVCPISAHLPSWLVCRHQFSPLTMILSRDGFTDNKLRNSKYGTRWMSCSRSSAWMQRIQALNWSKYFFYGCNLFQRCFTHTKLTGISSTCRKHFLVLSSFMTYHRVCN